MLLHPLIVALTLGLAADQYSPRYTPAQRMARERLEAATADARRHAASRRELPPPPGLHDYRVIFHAHAEDSAHTAGTLPEMLAEAKQAGVHAIFLSDHFRPPRDFIDGRWRGLREGVLFVPGSEIRGFLIHPTRSILDRMDADLPNFLAAVRADDGLAFLSHVEERTDHPMEGVDGLEIYNRHYDAKKDAAGLLALAFQVTDPVSLNALEENLRDFPDALFAAQVTYPDVYLAKWDRETAAGRRLTGVAANDCHHNTVLVVKKVDDETVLVGTNVDADEDMRVVKSSLRAGVRALAAGKAPGEVLARVDLDPYARSFRNVCTHVLAPALDESTIRAAVRAGHAYVSHDWMADASGFSFEAVLPHGGSTPMMGDETPYCAGIVLTARLPVACRTRLLRSGQIVAESDGDTFHHTPQQPGAYRLEAWLPIDDELRPWIYSNPIYLR